MEKLVVKGANYCGAYNRIREACRAVIVDGGKILLSYQTKNDLWMIPGGGKEAGESDEACVIREVGEETGCLFKPSDCPLQIDEYYEDVLYTSKYFVGNVVGTADVHLTEAEIKRGLESRRIPLEEAIAAFSTHGSITDYEEKRGLYQRELLALTKILGI